MLAIDGLDSALIGTAVRDGQEVLAYDASIVSDLLEDMGYDDFEVEDFVEAVGKMGRDSPVFIYLDREIRDEIAYFRRGQLRLV